MTVQVQGRRYALVVFKAQAKTFTRDLKQDWVPIVAHVRCCHEVALKHEQDLAQDEAVEHASEPLQ